MLTFAKFFKIILNILRNETLIEYNSIKNFTIKKTLNCVKYVSFIHAPTNIVPIISALIKFNISTKMLIKHIEYIIFK